MLHLATALVPVGYHYGVPRLWLVGALGLGTVVAFAVEWLRRRHPVVARTFTAWVGALLRPAEQVALTGATWLCLSCFLVVVWCPAPVAIAARRSASTAKP